MKVILTQEVKGLGTVGDVVNVKDGYARNYLMPRGLVLAVTPHNLKIAEEKKKKSELQLKQRKEDALALAEKLSSSSCTIAVKVIDEDRLFGSVTADMVHRALEQEGVAIDSGAIEIEEPIKKLGVYQVPIRLHPEVTASCKVWVVKE